MTTARYAPANNFPNPDMEKKAATVAIIIADNNTTYLNILTSLDYINYNKYGGREKTLPPYIIFHTTLLNHPLIRCVHSYVTEVAIHRLPPVLKCFI